MRTAAHDPCPCDRSQIEKWRWHAGLIACRDRAAKALEEWHAIDEKVQPLEEGIGRAVADFDDRINMEIHDRRP